MDKVELLIKHEAERLKMYKCTADKWTIGVVRNIEDNGIRPDESALMLSNDIKECEFILADRIDAWHGLSEQRRAVLINMVFNLGWPRFSKFKKMISAVEDLDFVRASAEMLDSKWARQVGNRAIELSDIMSTNKWSGE